MSDEVTGGEVTGGEVTGDEATGVEVTGGDEFLPPFPGVHVTHPPASYCMC